MSYLYEFHKRHARSILFITLLAMVILAWYNRFVQDDAFISFRYANHFARGAGLIWNEGERVEGYTNFLWTIIIAGVVRLGGDPVTWSMVLGLLSFAGSLVLTYKISLYIFQSDDIGLLAVFILGTQYTFSAYATGGLETAMQALLYLGIIYTMVRAFVFRSFRLVNTLGLSLLLTLCQLLRLDSAMLCVIVFGFATYLILKQDEPAGVRITKLAVLVVPFTLVIGSWFMWKLSYYGDILPNTFYAKTSSVQSLTRGFYYLHRYLTSYLLYPVVIIGVLSLKALFRDFRKELLLILLVMTSWVAYVVSVGGDFMEFRFLVPIIPLIVIFFMWLIFVFISSAIIRTGVVVLILFGSIHHFTTFTYNTEDGIEPIRQLYGHIVNEDEHWSEIGKALGDAFAYDSRVSIATTASGAIPYYSRLTTIDMLGLNDKHIARSGYYFGRAAGHERIATLSYLQERKVNIIVSHPYVTALSDPIVKVPLIPGATDNKLPESKALEIPIDSSHKVIVLYLTPSPIIDSVIIARQWKVHQIVKG